MCPIQFTTNIFFYLFQAYKQLKEQATEDTTDQARQRMKRQAIGQEATQDMQRNQRKYSSQFSM